MFEDIFVKSGYHNYVILRDDYYLGDGNIRYNHITNEIEFIDVDMTFVTSWAIGTPNDDGTIELLVACNEPLTGIKFVNRHIRPNIREIGNRTIYEPPIIHFATVIGEIVTVTGIMQDIEGYVYSDSLPILGQDEYEETIVVSSITAETEQYTGIIYSLESFINSQINPVLGQDEYGITTVTGNIYGDITPLTGGVYALEAFVNGDIGIVTLDYQWAAVTGQEPTVNQT